MQLSLASNRMFQFLQLPDLWFMENIKQLIKTKKGLGYASQISPNPILSVCQTALEERGHVDGVVVFNGDLRAGTACADPPDNRWRGEAA